MLSISRIVQPLSLCQRNFQVNSMAALALVMITLCAGAATAHHGLGRMVLQRSPADAARELCTMPDFLAQPCAFANDTEEAATTTCLHCGSMYRLMPEQLPAELEGHHTYYQQGVKVLSLTCKGPVVVRAVFKVHEGYNITDLKEPTWAGINCTNAGLVQISDQPTAEGGNASAVIRCELQLPATGGSEVERALKSKEVKCWKCGRCSQGLGCPSNYGVWYADTFTTTAQGCDFMPRTEYEAHKVGFVINLKTKVLLAKFEACNSPGCFDAAYEQAKLRTAKSCVNAKCDE